jgi:intraflagellar transport protein 52
MAVVGSCHMFNDQYLEKEENDKVLDVLFQWMAGRLPLNAIDAEAPDIADYHFLPSTARMADELRVCLQDGDDVPRDFTRLIATPLFQLDTAMVPEAIRLYDALNIPHEPLQLIPPAFETPLPPLQPAVRLLPGIIASVTVFYL